tara:strand:- start:310 stop:531 length:222 start_codon:yes stop_codon:yes gene_type:complete
MNKLESIINGWKNYIFENKEVEKIANQRAIICSKCDYNYLNICGQCGCMLPVKTRSLTSKCPLNKWNENKKRT